MKSTGYTLEECAKIQSQVAVGNTPLLELRNPTALARKYAKPGYGARIFAKMKQPTLPEALRPEEPPALLLTQRSWATKALLQLLPETTALL